MAAKTEQTLDASRAAFTSASDAYDAQLDEVEVYTSRAAVRCAVQDAKRSLNNAPDNSRAVRNYAETVAAVTDPRDLAPYIETEISEHTAAIDALTICFDRLGSAFSALSPTDELLPAAARLFEATSETYLCAAEAYAKAASCAFLTALEDELEARKDEYRGMLMAARAERAPPLDSPSANAKAVAFNTKVREDIARATRLNERATLAKGRAEQLVAKANAALTKVNLILDALASMPGARRRETADDGEIFEPSLRNNLGPGFRLLGRIFLSMGKYFLILAGAVVMLIAMGVSREFCGGKVRP